jgi:hypothetical protein
MERDGRLPPRDFFIGGVAVGWRPETIEAAERGGKLPPRVDVQPDSLIIRPEPGESAEAFLRRVARDAAALDPEAGA